MAAPAPLGASMKKITIVAALVALAGCASVTTDSPRITRTDHYVTVTSTAPSISGREAKLYLREVAVTGKAESNAKANGVVLFIHGSGTPASVSFDPLHTDHSWMAYLAKEGFDAFSLDLTGYGGSTRPAPMADPCNLSQGEQKKMIPGTLRAPCPNTYTKPLSTMGSDWDDIAAAVDHLRRLRGVDKVHLVGWSQGGPRIVGYVARDASKVSRIAILAPAYSRGIPNNVPIPLPTIDGPMSMQSRADFDANWKRQAPCAGQYEPEAMKAIFDDMLASDPVGSKWSPGIRRAPRVPTWGFGKDVVAKVRVPFLMVAGEHDAQVAPTRVRDLYADYGAKDKVFIDLACSSHNAMWEKNRLMLFKATADWLRDGKVDGKSAGELRMGYR